MKTSSNEKLVTDEELNAIKDLYNALGKFNINTVFCSKGCDSCVFHQNKIDNMSLCDVMVELEKQLIRQIENTEVHQEPDNVNHPSHYTRGNVECIDAIKAATVELTGIEAVCVANAIKYIWRYKYKNGVEDLKKAQWYLNCLVKELTKNE